MRFSVTDMKVVAILNQLKYFLQLNWYFIITVIVIGKTGEVRLDPYC